MQSKVSRLPLALSGLGALAALNLLIASRVAEGPPSRAIVLALLPAALIGVGGLISSSRAPLVYIALAFGIVGGPADGILNGPLPLPGTIKVYSADIFVCLALGAWLAAWLSAAPEQRPRWPRTPVLGWPLLLLAISLMQALIRGNDQYDTAILSEPVRLILYAGIAAAIVDLQPKSAFKWIVVLFYAGTLWHVFGALSRLASGANTGEISTGGFRSVALSTGMYLGGALVLALLSVDLEERTGRRALHLVMAGLASFGILASFGRTNYLVAGPLVLLLLLGFRRMRTSVSAFVPLAVPALVLIALLIPRGAPEFGQTLQDRLALETGTDTSFRWRRAATAAVWEQVEQEPVRGVGFGPGATFTLDNSSVKIGQDPHNGYVYLWAAGGLLAVGSFIALIIVFIRDAWRRLRSSDGVERALITFSVALCLIFTLNFATTPFITVPRMDLTLWIALLLPATVSVAGEGSARQASE